MTEHAPPAGPREWWGLAVLALPTLVLSLDFSVLYLAGPTIAADLQPSGTQMLWIIDIYGFMIAGFLITMGTVGDRIGRRRLLMIGALVFSLASVVAAFAPTAPLLVLARALLGIAGATLMPSTLALISTMFAEPRQRTFAISVWIACFMSGVGLGPVVGGLLLEAFWWGSVFLLAVPVMAILLVTGTRLLPEYRAERPGRLDLPSVGLSLGTILPLVYGLKRLAAEGPSALAFGSTALAILLGAMFIRRQLTVKDPLLEVSLFARGAFATALLAILVSTTAASGLYLLASQYLQQVQGLSPLEAGLWLVPTGIASVLGALSAPALAARSSPGLVVAAGLAVAVLGYGMLALARPDSGFVLVVTGIALVFFAGGPVSALGSDLVVGAAEPPKAGTAAALSETGTELGISLGVALIGSLGAAVYRNTLELPAALGPAATQDGLAGAQAAAASLPPTEAALLIASAQRAFTAGLNASAVVSGIVVAVLAVATALLLRERGSKAPAEARDHS